jgi:predicted RNA binding protein YcfA (HicA-like mRNA interferase family)
MPKLPTLTAQKIIKAIKKNGFTLDRSRGSHQTFLNPDKPNATVVIPVHPGKDIGKGLLKSLIKDPGLTESEFIQLL